MEVQKPVIVHCDNGGQFFKSNSAKQSVKTKHIYVRYHSIGDYIVNGMEEIIFVPSEVNELDIFTKNVSRETYERHADNFMTNM